MPRLERSEDIVFVLLDDFGDGTGDDVDEAVASISGEDGTDVEAVEDED